MFNTFNNRQWKKDQSPRSKNLVKNNPTVNAFIPLSKSSEKRRIMLNKYRNLDLEECDFEETIPDVQTLETTWQVTQQKGITLFATEPNSPS